MKPDECAMATAGVPMGRINARPDGTVTANVIIIGFIEKSIATPMVIGIKSATTAVLLMAWVKKIAKRDIAIIITNGYGIYVWSAFAFTLISFAVLYTVIKVQLVKEKIKFDAKYLTLTPDKKQAVRAQETYKGILASNSVSKI